MSKPIFEVKGLGKKYIIGAQREKYLSLRDSVANRGKYLINSVRGKRSLRSTKEEFWALRDVSFSVTRGEALGIIGRNGAGKSTLLKILSQITVPSEGQVTMRGRVASLLEVGTGFHPELTGRENIFLNGAILGMTRKEIRRKFDEIVDFAEIEKFLDTPVKRYSSGMYVRLAFAVAAHLEPEILVVDEVLAVGDAEFQKKCMGKMSDVASKGRTVLFVSHNMSAITRLCSRSICLTQGKVAMDGDTPTVVHKYLRSGFSSSVYKKWEDTHIAPQNEVVRLIELQLNNGTIHKCETVNIALSVDVIVNYTVLVDFALARPFIQCFNEQGICMFTSTDFHTSWYKRKKRRGNYSSKMTIPSNFLPEGTFMVKVGFATEASLHSSYFIEDNALSFSAIDPMDGTSARNDNSGSYPGVVRPIFEWETHVD